MNKNLVLELQKLAPAEVAPDVTFTWRCNVVVVS